MGKKGTSGLESISPLVYRPDDITSLFDSLAALDLDTWHFEKRRSSMGVV